MLLFHRYYDPTTGRFLTRDPIGYAGGANLYAYSGNNPVNGIDPLGLAVDAPGTLESFVPVWGSGKQAVHDFETGHPVWGTVNTVLAVSDVFLLKSLATAAGKGIWKVGSHTASATRKWIGKRGWSAFERQEMHHCFLRQGQGIGKHFPEWFKNQPWNLRGMPRNAAIHQAIHGKGDLKGFQVPITLWYGNPNWFKQLVFSVGGKGANLARGENRTDEP